MNTSKLIKKIIPDFHYLSVKIASRINKSVTIHSLPTQSILWFSDSKKDGDRLFSRACSDRTRW